MLSKQACNSRVHTTFEFQNLQSRTGSESDRLVGPLIPAECVVDLVSFPDADMKGVGIWERDHARGVVASFSFRVSRAWERGYGFTPPFQTDYCTVSTAAQHLRFRLIRSLAG